MLRSPLPLLLAALAACPGTGDDDATAVLPADDDDTTEVLPSSFPVTVRVEVGGAPAAGAWVLQGGALFQPTYTGADGRATLTLDSTTENELWVVAALPDHRSGGVRVREVPQGELLVELEPVEVDNPDYPWSGPGMDASSSTEHCSHCHVSLVSQWGESRHSRSASNPVVHDLHAGTASGFVGSWPCEEQGGRWLPGTLPGGAAGERCYLGDGLLPDTTLGCGDLGEPACDDPTLPEGSRPTEAGACADCHAPGTQGVGGGHDLLAATGLAFDSGVFCDFCHKVRDIDLDAPPGVAGRLQLGRPLEPGTSVSPWKPVMYGPYPDVLNGFMGGAWAPVFGEARFCAGCHEATQDALIPGEAVDPLRWPDGAFPVHTTWSEWSAGPLAASTPCQNCHMTPYSVANAADYTPDAGAPGPVFGFLRPAGSVRSHRFPGPLDTPETGPPLSQIAATLELMPDRDGDALTLTTTLHNTGAGHAIPTGEPLRHIIVAVSASCDGTRRPQILGPTVSGLGGAWGSGRVGTEIQVVADPEGCASCLLLWPGLPAELPAPETLAVRAIRPSGAFLDYDGPLDFASGGRFSVEEKGLPENSPIAEVSLVEAGPGWVRIAEPLPVVEGDVLFVSSAALPPGGGSPEPLAGFPGMDLARVLADAEGRQAVPHHRAVDVIRDNRVPAGGSASWELGWDVAGCETVDVIGRVYYRRFPWALARERGWNGVDTVFSEQSIQVGP